MKLRPLHTKKNFWKFILLVILVIGGSVAVILTIQKSPVFNESEAYGGGGSPCGCYDKGNLENQRCKGGLIQKCIYRYGTYYWSTVSRCTTGKVCVYSGTKLCGTPACK